MNITVLSYIDKTALEKSKANASANSSKSASSTAAATKDAQSFDSTLATAERKLAVMAIDAAIAEAKRNGSNGLNLNSAIAEQLGITSYLSASSATSNTSSIAGTAAASNTTPASSVSSTSSPSSGVISSPEELEAYFKEAADTYNVDINLLKSIAKAESNFQADALSSAGAMGIMQLMPSTASSLGVTDAYDARANILGGAKLISQLLTQYDGDTSLALAAYNAGSGNVSKYGGIPPFTETQNYVKKVLGYFQS